MCKYVGHVRTWEIASDLVGIRYELDWYLCGKVYLMQLWWSVCSLHSMALLLVLYRIVINGNPLHFASGV